MKSLNLNYSEGRTGEKSLIFARTFSGGFLKNGAKGTKLSWEEYGFVGFFYIYIFICVYFIFLDYFFLCIFRVLLE